MTWRSSNNPKERFLACLPYGLPLVEVISFGSDFFGRVPLFADIYLTVLSPFLLVYGLMNNLFPRFAGLIIFFILLLAVVRNDRIRHFIRYNTMQAILISIFVSLCQLVLQLLNLTTPSGLSQTVSPVLLVIFNLIFIVVVASSFYSIVQCIRGLYPDNVPIISEATRSQVP